MDNIWKSVTTAPWLGATLNNTRACDARHSQDPVHIVEWAALWEIIQRYLPADRSTPVLDLGGGTGIWSLRVAQEGYPVLFTEIAPANCEYAREKAEAAGLSHLIEFDVTDIRDLSKYPPSYFPLVFALGNPLGLCGVTERALREIARVTREQGILIGDAENRYRHLGHSRRAQSWADAKRMVYDGIGQRPYSGGVMPHREFTSHEIRDLLEEAGWEILEMYPSRVTELFLPKRFMQKALASERILNEVIELEKHMRQDPDILGCGTEIQFVARKIAPS